MRQLHTLIVWEFIFQLHTHLLHKRIVSGVIVTFAFLARDDVYLWSLFQAIALCFVASSTFAENSKITGKTEQKAGNSPPISWKKVLFLSLGARFPL